MLLDLLSRRCPVRAVCVWLRALLAGRALMIVIISIIMICIINGRPISGSFPRREPCRFGAPGTFREGQAEEVRFKKPRLGGL